MSLASWKREFYRTPANKVSKRYALQHSLKKWIGLLRKNRKKHKVSLNDGILCDESYNELSIDSDSCALCNHYMGDYKRGCKKCPLLYCNNMFLRMIDYNRVVPMISLLKKAVEKRRKR